MTSKDENAQQPLGTAVRLVPASSFRAVHDCSVRFRQAAVRLSGVPASELSGAEEAADAASALMDMVALGDEAGLCQVLRPDPQRSDGTWTVACYQIGDLTPSELRDFASAVEACRALASCEKASHVAAELVVSTAAGIRWTAAYRTGSRLTFQLPGTSSASSASSADDEGLAEAVDHWREQLERWAANPFVGLWAAEDVDAVGPAFGGGAGVTAEVRAALSPVLDRLEDLARRLDTTCSDTRQLAVRLERIERQLTGPLDRERSNGPPPDAPQQDQSPGTSE
jgi:hypothetical protein